jgi:serine/threonine protein kinase
MKLETWDRVQALFLDAADLRADEQQAFLDTHCEGDGQLRAMVAALLASDRREGASIQAAIENEATRMFESPLAPERLGAYRIEREIGRGGMGTVYLASRADDQFHKSVAIKVIKHGMDTAEALARFRDERQILANLDHGYIARLLDAGSTPDGRPFFVMEHVEGRPVDVFCREQHLDTKSRCRLFLKICEAVSYAHRNLVIHRDLKPANIFITPEGTPKLLDFGVAKLLDQSARNAETTSAVARPFTPEYASPEQVVGVQVTTAADVYSLGAVLYELVTGERAQPVREGASPREIEQMICESEPLGPRLVSNVDADLDSIVLAAMRKEPERRYASIDLLAEDIRRYLDSRPIAARKDSPWYRLRKFAKRQRYALGAGMVAFASLLCGVVIAFSEAREAKANLHAAVREQHRAEQRLAEIVSMSDRSLSEVYALMEPLPGALPARKELVSSTLVFLENLMKDASSNPSLQFAIATAYSRLGDIQGDMDASNIGDFAGALRSYRAASALAGESADNATRLTLWAELQEKIGKLLPDVGDIGGAREVLRHAIEVVDRSNLAPATRQRLRGGLYLYLSRATIDLPVALNLAQESRSAARSAAVLAPTDPAVQFLLSTAETQVGFVYRLMGDLKAAEPFYAAGMKIREHLMREHPNDVLYRRSAKLAYEHYADLMAGPERANLGRPDLARIYFEKARPIEEMSAADSQNSLLQFDYAMFLLSSQRIEMPPAEMERSLPQLRKAASIFAQLARAEPTVLRYPRALSSTQQAIGARLIQLGRYAQSVAEYRRAVAVNENILARDVSNKVILRDALHVDLDLIRALLLAGDRPAALATAKRAVRRALQCGPADLAESNLALAAVYQELGQCERSIELTRQVLSAIDSATDKGMVKRAEALLSSCGATPRG